MILAEVKHTDIINTHIPQNADIDYQITRLSDNDAPNLITITKDYTGLQHPSESITMDELSFQELTLTALAAITKQK